MNQVSQNRIRGDAQRRQQTSASDRGRAFPTRNDLPEQVRQSSVEVLNQLLADTTDLATQSKYCHWNVRGINFYQLHELFDEIAEALREHSDDLAERATALGGQARGTVRMAATNSDVPEIRTDAVADGDCVAAFADNFALHAANVRRAIDQTASQGDEDTADLLTELSREIDKYLWFLDAHVIVEPIGSFSGAGTQSHQTESRQASTGSSGTVQDQAAASRGWTQQPVQ